MRFFIERNPASDEWCGQAVGVFIREFCLLGFYADLKDLKKGWQMGFVFLNFFFGVCGGEELQ